MNYIRQNEVLVVILRDCCRSCFSAYKPKYLPFFMFQNPSDSEELFVALFDGNAGLVRKGNSGKSYEPPKYGSLLFDDDDDTENFVVSYSDQKTGDVSNVNSCFCYLSSIVVIIGMCEVRLIRYVI